MRTSIGLRPVCFGIAVLALFGCAHPTTSPPSEARASNMASAVSATNKAATPPCASGLPNAFYTGPYRGPDDKLTPDDMARDIHCAHAFRTQKYPRGFVAIYGSSRIYEKNTLPDLEASAANDAMYGQVRDFAKRWTQAHGKALPILHGAGPGIMEAAGRGAFEAGGPSIGYTTYYSAAAKEGNLGTVFHQYKRPDGTLQSLTTDGLIFSSVAVRETAMFLHSAAVVIAPGGTGTEWEIFQIVEMLKSSQLSPVPVYFLGDPNLHWKSLQERVRDMVRRGTLRAGELDKYLNFVATSDELLARLAHDLNL